MTDRVGSIKSDGSFSAQGASHSNGLSDSTPSKMAWESRRVRVLKLIGRGALRITPASKAEINLRRARYTLLLAVGRIRRCLMLIEPLQTFGGAAVKLLKVVWLDGHQHPFLVSVTHCVDLTCDCVNVTLHLVEVDFEGHGLPSPTKFDVRFNLKRGFEVSPPPRPSEVSSAVRQLIAEFPEAWIEELIEERYRQRTMQRRLAEYKCPPGTSGDLLRYSQIVYPKTGIHAGGRDCCGYFSLGDREFLIDDMYCRTPGCACDHVHLEFFDRTYDTDSHMITIKPAVRACFNLRDGLESLESVEKRKDSARDSEDVVRVFAATRFSDMKDEFRARYRQVKEIGIRSELPVHIERPKYDSVPNNPILLAGGSLPPSQVGRNSPCPCGSGRKFKQCCAKARRGIQ
jgi:uncharacterized protein YchJ